jgi:hypothetical protein
MTASAFVRTRISNVLANQRHLEIGIIDYIADAIIHVAAGNEPWGFRLY